MATSTVAGETRFARYAYPPNELGYCGPDGAEVLLEAAAGGAAGDVRDRARSFDGAWVYLEIIAAAAGIADPLDDRVVEAYWVGNALLDTVDPAAFADRARTAFAGESGADWRTLDCRSPHPVPHHSFQVFAVYPWVALLGRGDTARHVLDRCRIRTGVVTAVAEEHVEVAGRPLTWDGARLALGDPVDESVRWADDGRALSGRQPLRGGDRIALHWDWVCDRLSVEQAEACDAVTQRQLDLTNRVLTG
ncbi:MAG: DUF6390 family protein [Jatrophihabitans sp.]